MQDLGWRSYVSSGKTSGTTGKSKRVEAIKVKLTGSDSNGDLLGSDAIQVEAHVSGIGWQGAVGNDVAAGTTGQSRAVEAIKISLSSELASRYNIFYRVHSSQFGWLGWASNGDPAGSAGYSRQVEALQILLVPKEDDSAPQTGNAFKNHSDEPPVLSYSAHVSGVGWMGSVPSGQTAGMVGSPNAIEALSSSVGWCGRTGGVELCGHVSGIGWQNWASGAVGTTGQGKALECIQARLSGQLADSYDICYRVCSAKLGGWLGWATNGGLSGSTGASVSIQGIQFVLTQKGGAAPGSVDKSFVGNVDEIKGSVSFINSVNGPASEGNSVVLGSEKGRALSSFSLDLDNRQTEGSIKYQVYLQHSGWQSSWASNGVAVHGINDGMTIKAIRMAFDGALSQKYDLWYRVFDSSRGWSGWACNGDAAGCSDVTSSLSAIEIKELAKGSSAPGSTDNAFADAPGDPLLVYQAHVANEGWLENATNGATAGTTGKGRALQAINISLSGIADGSNVSAKAHVSGIGWQDWCDGSYAGTVGQSRAIEALAFKLEGPAAESCDIYYRVHAAGYGWLGWAKNGEGAGTSGLSVQAEAVQVKLVKKSESAPTSEELPYLQKADISVPAHVQNIGWQNPVGNGAIAGTTGRSLRIEALKLQWNGPVSGDLDISSHVQGEGWQSWVSSGNISGSVGKSLRVEAVIIKLSGKVSSYYDVWYRAHVEGIGRLGWAQNGAKSGTEGVSRRIEAIQVSVLPKGASASGSTSNAFMDATSLDTVLGVPRMNILGWPNRHLYDGCYLGTPFATFPSGFSPESCMYPNGSRRWDGYVGQNCAGFVAHVYQSAGGNLAPIAVNNSHSPWNGGPGGGAYINAWRWYGYAIDSGAHVYTFHTVRDMLASGVARKGDIIFFKTAPGIDCHIGIFWGDSSSDNKIWHQISPRNTIRACFNNANKGEVNQQVCILR